jgi:hypothetical protein
MGPRVAALAAGRRSRLWLLLVVAAVALLVIGGVVAGLDRRNTRSSAINTGAPSPSLPARTVAAGAVTVKILPRQLDARGAVFKVSFDTHSVDLNQDLARQARLTVGGTTWPVAGWSGGGPGGHHREGNLSFNAIGTAVGTATLSIDGLPGPVTATWDVGN